MDSPTPQYHSSTPEFTSEVASAVPSFQLSSESVTFSTNYGATSDLLQVIVYWAKRSSSSRGSAVLFVGPPDAGKTAILSTLVYKHTLPTHASLQANTSLVALSNGKVVSTVDIPGHPRIRNQFTEFLPQAKAVVFVVDASTVSRNSPAVAEHLHHVLHSLVTIPPSQTPPSLLILAHKCDLLKTSGTSTPDQLAVNRVRTILERELEKRRASETGGVGIEGLGADGGESSELGGLECSGASGGAFKFAEWEGGEVDFVGTSVSVGKSLAVEDEKADKSTNIYDYSTNTNEHSRNMYLPHHRLDTPPPPSQFRPRPWSPDPTDPLPSLQSLRDTGNYSQQQLVNNHRLSTGYQRQRRDASDASVEALDLADYAFHLGRGRQADRPGSASAQNNYFAFQPHDEYPPSPPAVRPFSMNSRDSLPSLVSSPGASSSQSHNRSINPLSPPHRPFSLPPSVPSASSGSAEMLRNPPYIVQSPASLDHVYEHPQDYEGDEIDIAHFPAWSRNWYPKGQQSPETRTSAQEPSPAFFDPAYTANAFSPSVNDKFNPYSVPSNSSRDLLPWSQNDPPGYAPVDTETKEERMRMLEREFGAKGTDENEKQEVSMVGGVDAKGNLVTQGPKKRVTVRVLEGLLALGIATASIYSALNGQSLAHRFMQGIKPSERPPPQSKPQTYALYVLSVISFLVTFYVFAIRPCCCGHRKGKSLGGHGPGGMMVLPVQSLPAGGKKKGKEGNQGQVQVNLIVDPTIFGQGQEQRDEEDEILPEDKYSSAVSSTRLTPGRRPRRRGVFEGLAMEEQWKRARKELKWFLFADILSFLLWGVEFVWVLVGPRCPPGQYNGWCTGYNVATAADGRRSLAAPRGAVFGDLTGELWCGPRTPWGPGARRLFRPQIAASSSVGRQTHDTGNDPAYIPDLLVFIMQSFSSDFSGGPTTHELDMPHHTCPNAVKRAVLLATIDDLETPHFLGPGIAHAARCTRDRVVIILFSRLFNTGRRARSRSFLRSRSLSPAAVKAQAAEKRARRDSESMVYLDGSAPGVFHTARWDDIQRLLTYVYVQATKVAQDMDKVLLEVDVLLKGFDENLHEGFGHDMEIAFRIDGDSIPVPLPQSLAELRTSWLMAGDSNSDREVHTPESPAVEDSMPSTFPVVALGGTFDHLHAGHKILVSMGAWIAEEKLIVGVTDDALLTRKTHREVLQPLSVRSQRVHDFLKLFKPSLVYDVVSINDVYGPTGWDPNIQALVVSTETLPGADAIDKHRAGHSLPPLKTFVIDVISHESARLDAEDMEMLKQTKMSSTFIREWIVNRNKASAEK
ncbi:hypothetical protein EW146_g6401 [Bondarzewia mesenterica]|uniref:Signal recognition particle receptor subunit beta n=1 Tax=Bondarzewia mesenterica TaxID=1095465 RepID=A0A4V3XEJ4_9AGAM|nr:hypothetical protein EW146_g6401 [Bondarzewia mesenterica]